MISTGNILRKYIIEKNITQSDLAKLLDVSPQYINNILNDIKSPSKNILKKFEKFLKISEEDNILIEKFEIYRKSDKIYQEINRKANFYGIYNEDGFKIKIEEKYIDTNIFDMSNVKIIEYNKNYMLFKDLRKNYSLKEERIYLVEIDKKIDIVKLEMIDDLMYLKNLNNTKYIFSKKNKKIKFISINIGSINFGGEYE